MKVANWDKHFENNRSRELKQLSWVPIPNSHDGEKYAELMEHKKAAEIFGAWVLMVQVASKCDQRGTLLRADGTPHDAKSLSRKTRLPSRIFEVAIPVLLQLGWIEGVTDNPAGGCENPAGGCLEGKGTEGKEQKGMEYTASDALNKSKVPPTVEEIKRYGEQSGYVIDAEHFHDHHSTRGWQLRTGKMKDWQAAVRTWHKNQGQFGGKPDNKPTERITSMADVERALDNEPL